MVSCEAADVDAASESDLRSVITSEDVIQLLREAYVKGHNEKIALILDYLRLMPMPPKDIPFLTSNVNALSGEIVRPSNMVSAVISLYRSLFSCGHMYRFSLQWGEDSDTIHFTCKLTGLDANYVPGDQMIYSVTIITCQDSKLVGLQFQVQVSFTLQNSGGDNSKMEPVFSLLPLDLHALLLPVYGVMDRHTIKLLISVDLQSSKGAMQSPSQFELVVQVQAFSPSSTASAPPPITSTTTSVSNGAPTNGETIAGSTSDDRLQTPPRSST